MVKVLKLLCTYKWTVNFLGAPLVREHALKTCSMSCHIPPEASYYVTPDYEDQVPVKEIRLFNR